MRSHLDLTLLVLSLLTVPCYAWVLLSSVGEIKPGKNHNLQLECKQENTTTTMTATERTFTQLITINRIRITKVNTFGIKSSVAVISSMNIASSLLSGDRINVIGDTSRNKMAYLRVTWSNVTHDDEGAYRCEIDGYDKRQNLVSLKTDHKVIKEKPLSREDMEDIINRVISEYNQKQTKLEKEIESMKSVISKLGEENKLLIKVNQQKHDADIRNLKSNVNLTYATKKELVDQGDEFETLSTDELRTHAIQDERNHTEILSIVQQTDQSCKNNYTELAQNILKLQGSVNVRINKIDTDGKNSIQQVNNNFKSLTTRVTSLNTKFDLGMKNIKEELSKKISDIKCTCPTPKPIVDSSGWPGGNAAMVEAMSGCPGPMVGKTVFRSVPYYTNTFVVKNRNVNLERGVKLYLHIGSMDTEVNFCLKEGAPSTQSWPKGTYCLNIIKGKCPSGFRYGYRNYHYAPSKGKKEVGMFMFKSCCRSDAKVTTAMKLPTSHPFYLMRHKGKCQTVEGMAVTEHTLSLKVRSKDIRSKGVNFTPTKSLPDTNKKRDAFHACYYYRA